MFSFSSVNNAWQGDMVQNLRDFFKKHLAACDPIIAELINAMNPAKKPSSLALEVKPLLLNVKPGLKFAMFVGNVDDFAYSDREEEDEEDDDEEFDSDMDSDDAGFEGESSPDFVFSQPTDVSSQSTNTQQTDSQNYSQESDPDSPSLIPSSQQ